MSRAAAGTERDRVSTSRVSRPRGRLRPWIPLTLLVLALGVAHLWWLDRFRRGFPLDVDESGYLWYSFVLHDTLRADGLPGMLDRIQGEGWAGPLFPAATAILELPAGARQIVPSMATQLPFLALLVGASFGIGRRLLDDRAGLLTALVVATTPATLDFVRTYHLVIPAAAMYTLAAYALLASDRLRRRSWAVLWGLALGGALLSRTMMIAFLPALPLAGGWILVVDRADRRRVANYALGLLALVAVAALWYTTSWRSIFDYLLGFGYGDDSPAGGGWPSPISAGFWSDELLGTIDLSLYLPLATIVVCVLALALAAASAGVVSAPRAGVALGELGWRAARSDAVVPAFVVVEGYLALTSSSNDGTGFVVPVLPCLVALAIVAAFRLPWRAARMALVAALVLVSAFDVVMKQDVLATPSRARNLELPLLGRLTLTNGRGFFHQHLVNDACFEPGSPVRRLPERDLGWLGLFEAAAMHLEDVPQTAPEPRLFLAQSEPLLSPSAVRLAAYRAGFTRGAFGRVETGGVDTLAAYRASLSASAPHLLLTTSAEGCHFGPSVSHERVERAAASLGFRLAERLAMPDGRELRVWAAPGVGGARTRSVASIAATLAGKPLR